MHCDDSLNRWWCCTIDLKLILYPLKTLMSRSSIGGVTLCSDIWLSISVFLSLIFSIIMSARVRLCGGSFDMNISRAFSSSSSTTLKGDREKYQVYRNNHKIFCYSYDKTKLKALVKLLQPNNVMQLCCFKMLWPLDHLVTIYCIMLQHIWLQSNFGATFYLCQHLISCFTNHVVFVWPVNKNSLRYMNKWNRPYP